MRTPLAVLAAAALGGAAVHAALAADTVTVRARAGQTFEGTIDVAGDTHAFLLEDFAPQLFSVTLKSLKGSALVPDLFLEDPTAADVTASLDPFRSDGTRSVVVRNADALQAMTPGTWVLRVGGKTGTSGGYRLKVKAKATKVFKGTGSVPASPDFPFFAPTASSVKLKVVPQTGSSLVVDYAGLASPPCVAADLAPGTLTGTATVAIPLTGTYTVTIDGNGGTQGGFNWIAKVKAFKAAKTPVRVNGGAVYFPVDGPAPAKLLVDPGQGVFGFDTDGVDLCWREVRMSGNPMQNGKNSVDCLTIAGRRRRNLDNNFATDPAPPARAVGLGPLAVSTVAAGELFLLARDGTGNTASLDTGLANVQRVLTGRDRVYVMDDAGIQGYDFMGGPVAVGTSGTTYHDMCFGGLGIVYAVTDAGGDLEVRTVGLDGTGDLELANITPNNGFQGLAARGPDAYVALGDGAGGGQVVRCSSCDPGVPIPVGVLPMAPILGLSADESYVYALENHPSDLLRVTEIPAGGGVPVVIARNNDVTGYSIDAAGLVAAKGFVYFLANDGGPVFYRVKRR